MTLTQAIHDFNFPGLNRRKPRYRRLEKAAERVEMKADGLEVPGDLEGFDYNEAILNLASGEATRRQIKRLATGGLSSLEERENGNELLGELLSAIDTLGRGLLKSLLIGYLISRDTDSWVIKRVRKFLYDRQDALPTAWRERIKKYQLLSTQVGSHCSSQILDSETFDHVAFANESGIKGVKGAGGVAYQIFHSLSKKMSQGHDAQKLDRYFRFVKVEDSVRFPSHIADYASALLSPYINFVPGDDDRVMIEHFMIEQFGDPRVNPGGWKGVPSAQTDVIKQWLAKASLELLLNVVSESNDTEQWEQRSKFWGHYFDEGLVTDAWVALGPAAASVARSLVRRGELASTVNYGVLEGGGVQSDHSVLIMRLGDFVVSEWTHSGKVRIYDARNKDCPRFYQRRYSSGSIRSDKTCNVAVIHHTRWRQRVSGFLNYEVGETPPPGIAPMNETRSCSSCRKQIHILWFPDEYTRQCTRCTLKPTYV